MLRTDQIYDIDTFATQQQTRKKPKKKNKRRERLYGSDRVAELLQIFLSLVTTSNSLLTMDQEDIRDRSTQVIDVIDKNLNVDHKDDVEERKDTGPANLTSILGFTLSDDFMRNVANNKSVGPDFGILEKVRSRLLGTLNDHQLLEDTQKIDEGETQLKEHVSNHFQVLPQLEVDESEYNQPTQVIDTKSDHKEDSDHTQLLGFDPTQVINKSTIEPIQVPEKADAWSRPATPTKFTTLEAIQVVAENSLQNLFVESEDEEDSQPMTAEERQRKIAQLAEEKKQARLQKEREELEQDMTKGSLTEDEDELNNEANDTVVSSHMKSDGLSTKELEKAREFINIQKRQIDIRPAFERKHVFTKEKFLDMFSDDDKDEDDEKYGAMKKIARGEKPSSPTMDDILKSSPTTSPVKDNAFDLFQIPSKSTQPSNPLELYAQRLKQHSPSSPSNKLQEGNGPMINLDTDSDIEIGHSSSPLRTQHKSRFSNHAKELDEIPELTKEQKFLIRQRFAKKKYQNLKHTAKDSDKHKQQSNFFKQLQKRNIDQLKTHKLNDPEHALLEELEKDEESMTSLLEREMERVRKIRKKEKLQERAKLALLGKKLGMKMVESEENDEQDAPENDVGSEVPESDYDSDDVGQLEAVEDEDEAEDEDEDEDEYEKENEKENENENGDNDIHINLSFEDEDDDEENLVKHDDDSHELFLNLQPRNIDESFLSTQGEVNLKRGPNLPLFKDLTQSQSQLNTQVDQPTQVDTSIMGDLETQVIKQEIATQADKKVQSPVDDEDDDDLITPARVNKGRKAMRSKMMQIKEEPENQQQDIEENEDDIEADEEDSEALKQKIKEYEQKIRRKELQARKRRKEMEKSGMKTMFDGEAEESEDEWKGLGGIDGEFSDVANSEDEKMIDNNFNIDLQDDEIRKKFMEEYQIKDQQELEKLLDDIKNHKLIKRVGQNNNGFDIELSDEEDQLLAAYRKQKLIEQQQRLMQNKKLQALSKDEKSKAFFDTIQDKHEVIVIDSDSDSDVQVIDRTTSNCFAGGKEKQTKEKEPTFGERDGDVVEIEDEDEDSLEKEAPIKQTIKIEESFVQSKLSFLYQSVYDDADDDSRYNRIQRLSKLQHGISDEEEEEIDDINALKSKSILQPNRQVTNIAHIQANPRKRKLDQDALTDAVDGGDTDKDDDDDDDVDNNNINGQVNLDAVDNEFDDDELMPIFKKPSVTKSFKSFQEQKGITFNKQGKQQFLGVTISKQYKVVCGSKASITYMSKLNQGRNGPQLKSFKERQIEQSLHSSRNHRSGSGSLELFSSSDFL